MNHGKIEQSGTPDEVFEHPANPFVMDFLGNVNVFHGRVQNGRALVGSMDIAYPEYPHEEARAATMYVRPHELEIEHTPDGGLSSLKARVERINASGPVAKIFLMAADFGLGLNVELSPERYDELALKAGDTVYVSPRRVRVFVPEYVI
jgi:sulfate transport system ATP-binding protein